MRSRGRYIYGHPGLQSLICGSWPRVLRVWGGGCGGGGASDCGKMICGRWPCFFAGDGAGKMYDVQQPLYVRMYSSTGTF
jgi:hypothetical protein